MRFHSTSRGGSEGEGEKREQALKAEREKREALKEALNAERKKRERR